MPAIQLARLRLEVAELAEHFQNPEHFANHLNHLLEFYADRTQRPKLKGAPPSALKTFHIPQPVFRQLLVELGSFAETNTKATIAIIDRCWAEPVYEFRQLSIHLFGLLSPLLATNLLDRVHAWLDQDLEDSLVHLVFNVGLGRMREEAQLVYIELVESLFSSKKHSQHIFGLVALLYLTKTESFINLPMAFRLFQSSIEHENKYFRPYLFNIFKQLILLSHQETSYIIKHLISTTGNKEVRWLARQSIELFPKELGDGIKVILRKTR